MATHTFDVIQDGMTVASVTGPEPNRAMTEALHYAQQYRSEGAVTVRERTKKRSTAVEITLSARKSVADIKSDRGMDGVSEDK